MATYRGSVLPILVLRLDSYFSVTATALGLLLSAGAIGRIFVNIIAGPLLDILGSRKMLVFGYSGYIFVFLFASLADSYSLFLLAIIAIGFCAGIVNLAAPLYILKLFPEWKRKSFSLNMVSGLLPGLFFPVIIEYFMNAYPDNFTLVLHLPFGILAGLSVLLLLLFFYRAPHFAAIPVSRKEYKTVIKNSLRQYKYIFTQRKFWIFPLLIFLHAGADSLLHNWIPTYLKKSFSILPIGTGMVLMLFALAYFLSRVFLILIPDEKMRRIFLVLPGVLGGSILLFGLLSKNALISSLCYPIGGFFWSFEAPSLLSEAYRRFSGTIGTVQAMIFLVSSISGILLINITGILIDAGVPLFLILCSVSVLFMLFSFFAAFSSIGKH
jgi:MFS family permease